MSKTLYERIRHSNSSTVNSESNKRRIFLVESCFGSAGQPLAVKGRVLIGEGVLTKACRKKPKPRQFFLFNDLFVYGNIIINKKKYNKQRIIPLEEVKLVSLKDDGQYKNGWLICTRGKSFAVYAATSKEKDEWMSHIQRCIDDLLSTSGKKPPVEHAAVWVPDAEAQTCMVCKKYQFTVLNRRHHCRKCGAVVCGHCSTNRALLPSQSTKPMRVCDSCHGQLSLSKVLKSNSSINNDTRPVRPPEPKLFNEDINIPELKDLPEIPQEDIEINIPKRNPKLYELVNFSENEFQSSFWYDEGDLKPEEDNVFESLDHLSLQYDDEFECRTDAKEMDTSGEDDSDEDDSNMADKKSGSKDKSDQESHWYDSSAPISSGVAALPAITAHDLNLSPLSQISPLPRAAPIKK